MGGDGNVGRSTINGGWIDIQRIVGASEEPHC